MDTPDEVDHSIHAMDNETAASNNQITFPFAFPRTGSYRIWVQVKIEGTVMTEVLHRSGGSILIQRFPFAKRITQLAELGRDDNCIYCRVGVRAILPFLQVRWLSVLGGGALQITIVLGGPAHGILG
jgi:hypothetical protein